MIRVLVVEDLPVVREFLTRVLETDSEIRVIGTATDGEEGVAKTASLKPDVVTMDIHMPRLDGFKATRSIMESFPTPIVIVSGSPSADGAATSFRALEAGALAVVKRPVGFVDPGHAAAVRELVQTVKLMSEVKVVRRRSRPAGPGGGPETAPPPATLAGTERAPVRLVAIGASTGGPPVLKAILSALPGTFSAAVVVVQHIAEGFTAGFVEWLADGCRLPVKQAAHGDVIVAGRVLVAPNGRHVRLERSGTLSLVLDPPEEGHRPSVSYLFRSVAETYGKHAVGVLLTGMGRDGGEGMRQLRQCGAVTIAQDAKSSVVHGMPGEAIRLGGVQLVAPPEQIAETLLTLTRGVAPPHRPGEGGARSRNEPSW